MTFYVGVEGIGSRFSVAVLADGAGTVLAATRTRETLNLHTIPPLDLGNRLKALLQDLFHQAGLDVEADIHRTYACIGMSGVTFSYERLVELRKIVEVATGWTFGEHGERLACTGDAEIVFPSHCQRESGSLVIAHMGSVAYVVGRRDGKLCHYRFGGWGPQLGDEGSAYWIGRAALRAICLEHAQGADPSELWHRISAFLAEPHPLRRAWDRGAEHWQIVADRFVEESERFPKMDRRTLVYRFAHQAVLELPGDDYRHAIAALVIPVMEAYRKNDPTAIDIINTALAHLDEQHEAAQRIALRRSGITQVDPIVLYGGVFSHNPELVESFRTRVERRIGRPIETITIRSPGTMRPAVGALLFALGHSESNNLQLPSKETLDQVRVQQEKPRWKRALVND